MALNPVVGFLGEMSSFSNFSVKIMASYVRKMSFNLVILR